MSIRTDASCAVAAFSRLYPKEARSAIVDIVAAYGIRCVLNEVPLEQLSLARLREVAARMERKWKWLKTKEGRGRRL